MDSLRSTLTGELVLPGEADWDGARQAWNLSADQHPAAVVYATTVDDIAATIAAARAEGLRVAPQGTGHGASALGDLSDTLLLKTARMASATIDADARTVRVEPGALWGDVAIAAGEHGLAALAGTSIDVGVVGYTLGGGLSWLCRQYGLATRSVRAVELITADGERRRVEGDDELFWALRGGGGSFGVVTAMELELYPIPEVYAGTLVWPVEAASEVLHAYREWTATLPDEAMTTCRLLHLPPLPMVPELLRDRAVIDICFVFNGSAAEGESLIQPVRSLGEPMIDTLGTIPTADLRSLHGDPEQPVPGLGAHTMLRELAPETADALLAVAGEGSGSPLLAVELRQLGGALSRPQPGDGALATLDAAWALYGVGLPMGPPGIADAIMERLGMVVSTMEPWSTGGTFPNFGDEPDANALPRAFDAETLARLVAVKRAVDPDNVIRANHPVPLD